MPKDLKKDYRAAQPKIQSLKYLLIIGLGLGICGSGLTTWIVERKAIIDNLNTKALTSESLINTKPLEALVLAVSATGDVIKNKLEQEVPRVHYSLSKTIVANQANWTIKNDINSHQIKRLSDRTHGVELAVLNGHTNIVSSITFSPDGLNIASASWDKTVRLWSTQGGKSLTLNGHKDDVNFVIFNPDGSKIVSASSDKTVRLWSTQGERLDILIGHQDDVNFVTFSPDGSKIASASSDGTVRLWNDLGEELATLTGHTSELVSVAFSPDGSKIASASSNGAVRLWNDLGEELATLTGHTSELVSVVFSPDGSKIASASSNGTIRLWNDLGEELATLTGHTDIVWSFVFSPDGSKIVSASSDGTVRLWNDRGQQLATLTGHINSIYSVAFSPDGTKIATAGSDNTVRLWSTQGQELAIFTGHTDWIVSVAFSPDGSKIASASSDGTVRLWPGNLEYLLAKACEQLQYHPALLEPLNNKEAKKAADACFNLKNIDTPYLKWNDLEIAKFQRDRGLAISRKGKYSQGAIDLKKAQQRYPAIDLNPDTLEKETNPDLLAKQLAAPVFVKDGMELAKKQNITKAISLFKIAQKFSPDIDLNPKTKNVDRDPEKVAKELSQKSNLSK